MPASTGCTTVVQHCAFELGRQQRTWRERAHPAGVRPAVARRARACDPAPSQSASPNWPSDRTKNDTSGPSRHASSTMRRPASPKRVPVSISSTTATASLGVVDQDDALARRQAVGLDDERPAEPLGANRVEGDLGRLGDDEAGRRHAVARHELLRPDLAGLDARGRRASARESAGPASTKRSTTPTDSGSSGPTIVRVTPSRSASASMASGSDSETAATVPTAAMPALPGAQTSRSTPASRDSRPARACSRAPDPRIRMFTEVC